MYASIVSSGFLFLALVYKMQRKKKMPDVKNESLKQPLNGSPISRTKRGGSADFYDSNDSSLGRADDDDFLENGISKGGNMMDAFRGMGISDSELRITGKARDVGDNKVTLGMMTALNVGKNKG